MRADKESDDEETEEERKRKEDKVEEGGPIIQGGPQARVDQGRGKRGVDVVPTDEPPPHQQGGKKGRREAAAAAAAAATAAAEAEVTAPTAAARKDMEGSRQGGALKKVRYGGSMAARSLSDGPHVGGIGLSCQSLDLGRSKLSVPFG